MVAYAALDSNWYRVHLDQCQVPWFIFGVKLKPDYCPSIFRLKITLALIGKYQMMPLFHHRRTFNSIVAKAIDVVYGDFSSWK